MLNKKNNDKHYIRRYPSPLGEITIASDGSSLTGLWFDGEKYDRDGLLPEYEEKSVPVLADTVRWLDQYFAGKEPDFTPPLAPGGSPFRQEVAELMLEIPYGATTTYGELARRLAEKRQIPKMSSRAVGGAVGRNPISLIIPCHRVVGSDGSLTGYGGGLDRKIALLKLEHVDLSGFYRPKRGTAL
ncbi:MAG: methylated-DNA--[protein]-cysteine S-methyltransferase [Anaerovoracaceae bacterium]|jgi:methylated-DNA-[protein]-cysteine S-methyltransferase